MSKRLDKVILDFSPMKINSDKEVLTSLSYNGTTYEFSYIKSDKRINVDVFWGNNEDIDKHIPNFSLLIGTNVPFTFVNESGVKDFILLITKISSVEKDTIHVIFEFQGLKGEKLLWLH